MKIGIIGQGRFGSLLTKHLRTNNQVTSVDRDAATPDVDALKGCELIIFAVPNRELAEVVKYYKSYIAETAIVMDVGSVKVKPCQLLESEFTHNVLGTHPLFGPDSAGDSWEGQKMVFCKLHIDDQPYQRVKDLFVSRGVQAIECTPDEHDRMMAKTQALVHFIGRALTGIQPQEIATPDYANLLKMMEKVTNDTWELFFDMQHLNPYAEEVRKDFLAKAHDLEQKINTSDK